MTHHNTPSNPAYWAYEAMRTGSHLPPLPPRPQASAFSARAPMTLSYRPKSTIIFDPISSRYVATGTVEVPPQIGYFRATPPRSRPTPETFSDIAVSKHTPGGRTNGDDGDGTSAKPVAVLKDKPTDWIHEDNEDEIFADQPGHAAYYKSSKFQDKVAQGKVQIPGGVRAIAAVSREEAVKEHRAESEPLVMIFGLSNVRRARVERKCDLRLRKYNKRTKWMRKTDGVKSRFGWD